MHVQYHYSRHLRLASIDGERSRFCPEDRDDELEEYHLRAAERNLSWDATLNEIVNWKGRSPSRWIGIWFASLESERLRLRLLPLELESESESESEEEEALSDLESESELGDPYEARTCQNFACSSRIYTDCPHLDFFLPLSLSPIANLPISFFAASSRSRSMSLRIL